MIPFRTGVHVTGADFCPRKKELEWLRESVESAGRVYVVGERRIGKSSLIAEAIRPRKALRPVFVDLMALKDLEDFTHRLGQAILASEKRQSRVLTLMRSLASLRPSVTLDSTTGSPSVSFVPGTGTRLETLDEIFAVIGQLKNAVVVLDEFQDVLTLRDSRRILARLRGLIQTQQSGSFVFSGSIRNQMEEIFTNQESPFFNSATRLWVGPLDRALFLKYLRKRFERGDRHVAMHHMEAILDACHENPGHVQRFCISLWQVTSRGQEIGKADMAEAWNMLFGMQRDAYELALTTLSPQQARVLRALAHVGGESTLSAKFTAVTGITLAASVRKAMVKLVARRLVQKDETTYRICDPFLAVWLRLRAS
jgi:hypothetical protein